MLCLIEVFWIDTLSAAKFFGHLEFARIDVDADDA